MALEEIRIPAYITIAFSVEAVPRVTIQQIQYRDVILRDGVAIDDGKVSPPEFIVAPQANDIVSVALETALGALHAACLEEVRVAGVQRDDAEVRAADLAARNAILAEALSPTEDGA